jgi:hypothetical protein
MVSKKKSLFVDYFEFHEDFLREIVKIILFYKEIDFVVQKILQY